MMIQFIFEFIMGVQADGTIVYFYAPKGGDVRWSPHQHSAENIHSSYFTYCSCRTVEEQKACTVDDAFQTVLEGTKKILAETGKYDEFYLSTFPRPDTMKVVRFDNLIPM
jgi:hypothetical protein